MQTFILLMRYTQKGFENIKDSPARLDAARKAFSAAGANLKAFYLTTGQYDAIAVVEAPNDETLAKLSLGIAALGFLRGETLRAFPESEYRALLSSMP